MNILVIPTTDWIRHPTPHRHHYLVEKISRNHEVFVLHFDIFKGKRTWNGDTNLIESDQIHTESLIAYYLSNAPFHFNAIRNTIKRKDIDIIIASHLLPSLLGFYASRTQRKFGNKILNIFDFNDFYPEGASLYYENWAARKIVKIGSTPLLNLNLRSADLVTTVSLPMYNYAMAQGAKNVEIIPNGVDVELFRPSLNVSSLREELKLESNVIGFVGTMERWFDIQTLILGFKRIIDEIPNAQFLMVGGSIKTSYSRAIWDLVKKLDLEDRIIMTGTVPYKEVPKYINLMRIAVIPPINRNLFMREIALPNKFFQYLACGRIVLTSPYPEIMRIGKEVVVQFNNEEEFTRKAVEILKSNKEDNPLGIEFARHYDWMNQARKLERIFDEYRLK